MGSPTVLAATHGGSIPSPLTIVFVVAGIVYLLWRRLQGEPLQAKRLLVPPLLFGALGITDLTGSGAPRLGPESVDFLAVGGALSFVLGGARGATIELSSRQGQLRQRYLDGTEATRRIRQDHPATAVVVLTTYADDESILAALRAGAIGYLTKDAGREEIARALHAAAAGEAILDPAVQARLVAAAEPAGGQTRPSLPLPDGLTPREAEVLALIAAGRSNAQIAEVLVVSGSTVKTHINNLFAKAGITDRARAVQYAYRHGLAVSGEEGRASQ